MSRGQLTNEQIKNRVLKVYRAFIKDVDPLPLSDYLIQNRIITPEDWHTIKTERTPEKRCRELLHHLFSTTHPRAFIVVRKALKSICRHIYDEIENQTDTETVDELSATHNDQLQQLISSLRERVTELEQERNEARGEMNEFKDRFHTLEAQLQSGKRKRLKDESNAVTKRRSRDTVDFMQTGEEDDFEVELTHDLVKQFKKVKAESKYKNWWKSILKFEWRKIQKSTYTQWVSIKFKSREGMKPLIIGMLDELNVGTIAPSTEEEASKKNVEIRTTRPQVQIQKWATQFEEKAPNEKYRSSYYDFISIVSEAFEGEVRQLLEAGKKFVANYDKIDFKYIELGEMILSLSDMEDLEEKLSPDAFTELQSRVILAPNDHIVPLAQLETKDGIRMTNPLTRIYVNFDKTCRRRPTELYTKMAEEEYEPAVVDGEEVDDENIHKYIRSQCRVTGTIQMDSVCFSDKGISIPRYAIHLIVETPKYNTPKIGISHLLKAIAKTK